MRERLDDLLELLAHAPIDRSLDGMEIAVGHRIDRWEAQARTSRALAPVGVAATVLALAVGLAVGGATAVSNTSPPRSGASVVAALAPSSLLED